MEWTKKKTRFHIGLIEDCYITYKQNLRPCKRKSERPKKKPYRNFSKIFFLSHLSRGLSILIAHISKQRQWFYKSLLTSNLTLMTCIRHILQHLCDFRHHAQCEVRSCSLWSQGCDGQWSCYSRPADVLSSDWNWPWGKPAALHFSPHPNHLPWYWIA